jgi:hypothetical protein
LFFFKKLAPDVDKTEMEEAREKPKILLLRGPMAADANAPDAAHWSRLVKALRTFTELEEREASIAPSDLVEQAAHYDFIFLDDELADWPSLGASPISRLALVRARSFPWAELRVREERLDALAAHPLLLLEGFSGGDLLRLVHLFLIPKRLAGVTPLMEKGSLILGEKVMEKNAIGQLLDRVCTFCEKLDDFGLSERLPDLRQVLSAVLLEGLGCAGRKSAVYPFVDFQLAIAPKKLAVNLRFPLGGTLLSSIARASLNGGNLFWQQIWQCSDATLLTHHLAQDELEVTLLLCRPERNTSGTFRAFLHKTTTHASRAVDLLDPPHNFRFLLVSEIQSQENTNVQLFTQQDPLSGIEGLEAQGIPEAVTSRLRQLAEQCRVLSDHTLRKDEQIQDYLQKNQAITREANIRRSELLRSEQARETITENSERRIRELEANITQLKDAAAAGTPQARNASSLQDMVAKMESSLRAAENDKTHLRDSLAHEQRRATSLELKYSQLYKDLAARERDLHEMRALMAKFRREQTDRPAKATSE